MVSQNQQKWNKVATVRAPPACRLAHQSPKPAVGSPICKNPFYTIKIKPNDKKSGRILQNQKEEKQKLLGIQFDTFHGSAQLFCGCWIQPLFCHHTETERKIISQRESLVSHKGSWTRNQVATGPQLDQNEDILCPKLDQESDGLRSTAGCRSSKCQFPAGTVSVRMNHTVLVIGPWSWCS